MSSSSHDRSRGPPSLAQASGPTLRSSRPAPTAPVEVYSPRHGPSEPTVTNRDISELVSRFQALSTSPTGKIVRPGFGTHGAPIALHANLFTLNFPQDVALYDYVIKVQPTIGKDDEDLRKHVVKLFIESPAMVQFKGGIAHDGSRRLIAKLPLPKDFKVKVDVSLPNGQGTKYTVILVGPKELKSADLARYLRGADPSYNPAPIVSAFNLIIAAREAQAAVRADGKHAYYFEPRSDSPIRTRAGITVALGLSATVRPVFKNLMLNLNSVMSAFYIPGRSLSDAMLEFGRQSQGAVHPQKFFGRMRVTTKHLGYSRRSTVKGFGSESASKTTIRTEDMGKTTVERYFRKKYGVTLRHAEDLPVVNLGTGERDVFVPAELCWIEPGSLFTGQLTPRENAALCAKTSKTPAADAKTVVTTAARMFGLDGNEAPLNAFNMKVSFDMALISARVLPAPHVVYQSVQPAILNGGWSARGVRFDKPAEMKRLVVLVLKDYGLENYSRDTETQLRESVTAFLRTCRSLGMDVDPEYILRAVDLPRPSVDDPYRDDSRDAVKKALESLPGKPDMVLTLMSNKDALVNAALRRLFDVTLGCHALVALIENMLEKEGREQYLTNLAFKLNAKLGGVNHRLDRNSLKWLDGTMLVGMDMTHPGAGARKGAPSIAAVAASCDATFARYPASVSKQEQKITIANLREMIVERLKEYRKNMGKFPERIVIFRAGVSDSVMEKVMQTEIAVLKKTFGELQDYRPKVTYIVCSKGHGVRFYPTREQDVDATTNSVAGTVIDQGVTSIYDYDFYLQAHAASQGVARATHYTVVYDENKYPPDVLQQGLNNLSYLWAPASRSVRLVPPAYWADRACARARLYIVRVLSPGAGTKETRLDDKDTVGRASGLWGDGIHKNLLGTMYYV